MQSGRIALHSLLLCLALAAASPAEAGREPFTVPVTSPQPATLMGELYTPSGDGPFPAVVLLHGCGGATPNVRAWARWLQSRGYAALVLNSFGGRGLRNLCGDSAPLTPAMRSGDVFAAVAALRATSGIDSNRIAAMGFSHGGSTVLAAWREQNRHPDAKLAATVAFYPGCRNQRVPRDAAPLLILAGGKDDWTPAEPCRTLAEAARAAKQPVTIVIYPDARHHFDGAHVKKTRYISVARGGKGATVEYNAQAHADAEQQVERFLRAELGGASGAASQQRGAR